MVDNSTQMDYAGNTIIAKDIILGIGSGLGASGSSASSVSTSIGMISFLKFVAPAVNFNVASTDTPVAITLPAGINNYIVNKVSICNASHTLVTATVGVFGAASGGTPTISANQAITVTNGTANTALNTQSLTLASAATIAYNLSTLYVRVGTAEGTAATADVVITIQLLN